MVVFFEGRREHPVSPTLSWGAGGREQLHKTLYAWVVVFLKNPGGKKMHAPCVSVRY